MFSENNYQVHLDVENVHQKKKKKGCSDQVIFHGCMRKKFNLYV